MSKYIRRQFAVSPSDWSLNTPSKAMLDGVSKWIVDNVSDDLTLPKLLRQLANQLEEYKLNCDICDAVFSHRRSDARFCSLACRQRHYMVDHKRCKRCERVLPRIEFRVAKKEPCGLQKWCTPCMREYQRIYLRDTEVGRKNRKKNRSHERVRKASPIWRDKAKIRAVYTERDRLIKETGIEHHVDHDIPLNGIDKATGEHNVCGLHVHNNLKPIPANDNVNKGGWYAP